ncbi:MAG: hypothetical protein PHR39_09385, partial [Actinomycetota bacterium]|nr:hypothetical protein [Actinomycetota bacterium]
MDIKKELRSILNILGIAVVVLAVAGFAIAISYYFLVYLKPNFDGKNFNYVKSISSSDVKPGSEIVIEFSYTNTGNREVKDFTAQFHIPQYVKFKISNQPGIYVEDKNLVVFENKNLKKNEGEKISITLIADKPLDNGTAIKFQDVDIIYVVSDKQLAGKIHNGLIYNIVSSPEIKISGLRIEDINGGDIRMGDEVSFKLKAENTGDMNATGIEVTAAIPPKTSIIKNSVKPDGCEISKDKLSWKLDMLETNNSVEFSYKLKVLTGFKDNEKIKGTINLKTVQGDDINAEAIGEVRLFPDLSNSEVNIADKNGEFIWAGDILTLKAVIENTGEKTASDVKFSCPVPDGTEYVKNSAKCDDAKISLNGNMLLFEVGKIDIGEKKDVYFELRVLPKMTGGGTVKTDYKISANGTDFQLKNAEIKIKANYQTTICCLGDSLIALSTWPQILDSILESTYVHSDYNVIASGVRGEMAISGYQRFDSSIAEYKPQIIIIGYGTNDIGSGTDKFSHYLSAIVKKAKDINATVFLESLGFIDTNKEPKKSDWQSYQKVIYQV